MDHCALGATKTRHLVAPLSPMHTCQLPGQENLRFAATRGFLPLLNPYLFMYGSEALRNDILGIAHQMSE